MNRSIGKSPFAIVCGQVPRHTLDLLDFPKLLGMSFIEENLANRIKAVLVDVKKQPEESNAEYKMDATQEGDLVRVHLRFFFSSRYKRET